MRKNAVRAKLASQRGATIIFALFFFIVCAVIGSIVLTAGTAAAGRLAQVKEMDEHYYAVNSAAEVLEYELSKPDAYMMVREQTDESGGTVTTRRVVDVVDLGSRCTTAPVLNLLQKAVVDSSNNQLTGLTSNLTDLEMKHSNLDTKFNTKVTVTTEGAVDDVESLCNLKIQVSDTKGEYTVTMFCPAHFDKRVYQNFRTGIPTTEYKVTWSVSSVMKGAW